MGDVVFHVDLDAFFASVEQLDRPELRGRPVVVGAAPGRRGVVSTCSYEARAYGIHSAMPISEAWRRCPGAAFLPVRMERYAEISERVMEAFGEFSPEVRRVSIDEAFLGMAGTERLWGPPAAAAAALKARVRERTGLSISVGVAANHYVAKIASGLRKPDGLVVVEPGGEAAFMLALPLGKLWGAGEKTQERFAELGIRTTAQLAAMSERSLASLFGGSGGRFLYEAVRGRDPGIAPREAESRSVSAERTFELDVSDRSLLEALLVELADQLAYRLWSEDLRSRCVFIKLRFQDFSTLTRRRSRPEPFASAEEARAAALALLDSAWDGRRAVRLLGLGFAELEPRGTPLQGELFDGGSARKRAAEEAVFEIERRGLGSLRRARLVDRGGDPTPSREPP